MTVTRTFLGWEEPAVHVAARHLCDVDVSDSEIDLSATLVVVPGSRAGRILLETLVWRATEQRLPLIPPRIVTVGEFPEQLYVPAKPFAQTAVQHAAWARAMQSDRRLRQFLPHAPPEDALVEWAELGQQVAEQFRELRAEQLSFADVAQRARTTPDADRWKFLASVEQIYLNSLEAWGLSDRDQARTEAIATRRCRTDRSIVLLAVAEFPNVVAAMIDQIDCQVTALVHAPESRADAFDGYGRLITEQWVDYSLSLPDEMIHVVAGPREQANVVVETLTEWSSERSVDEVRIGVPDVRLVPELQMALLQRDIPSRWLYSRPFSQTGLSRLLELTSRYLREPSYDLFSAVLRHPDLRPWFAAHHVALSIECDSDRYYAEHVPPRVETWLGDDASVDRLRFAHRLWEEALSPLRRASATLQAWPERILDFLATFYDYHSIDLGREDGHDLAEILTLLRDKVLEWRQAPAEMTGPLSAGVVLDMLRRQLERVEIPSRPRDGAVEMLGWLELPLDPAPAVVITSVSEGFVPVAAPNDPLLPESLRSKLGLPTGNDRLARDAYILESLRQTRSQLRLIAAKSDTQENPLVPSRLLLRGDDRSVIARCRRWFDQLPSTSAPSNRLAADIPPATTSPATLPTPVLRAEPLETMSVTSFRDYLRCPYQFYLRHIEKLDRVADRERELSPRVFGNLLHDTLERFGESEVANSADVTAIGNFLMDTLEEIAVSRFGPKRHAAVQIQMEVARQRLERFAILQAQRAAEGWVIQHTELAFGDDEVHLSLRDGATMVVRGRIDRIDWHAETDSWQVLDYKTSDSGKKPQQTHLKRNQWIDLQLPLYRYMLQSRGFPAEKMELGYILLPQDLTKITCEMASWSEDQITAAHEVAIEVAQGVHDQVFWPPTEDAEIPRELQRLLKPHYRGGA